VQAVISEEPEDGIGAARCDVRYGSLADIVQRRRHVRFTPDSGHSSVQVGRPKSAISRHLDRWYSTIPVGDVTGSVPVVQNAAS
jgi:hypothetical protein